MNNFHFCQSVETGNRRRFEGRTFVVGNGSFPMVWRLPWRMLPVRPDETAS
jgi:hypothetical protein